MRTCHPRSVHLQRNATINKLCPTPAKPTLGGTGRGAGKEKKEPKKQGMIHGGVHSFFPLTEKREKERENAQALGAGWRDIRKKSTVSTFAGFSSELVCSLQG